MFGGTFLHAWPCRPLKREAYAPCVAVDVCLPPSLAAPPGRYEPSKIILSTINP